VAEVADLGVCPDCQAQIEIDEFDVDKGEVISCPECGVELQVLNVAPLEFDVATDDEDWSR
jgi:alpha-aminoadipate/glutamate carrier protein LysW